MTHRNQPPRLKGLKWHDPKPLTRAEQILMTVGWMVAALGTLVVLWSFF